MPWMGRGGGAAALYQELGCEAHPPAYRLSWSSWCGVGGLRAHLSSTFSFSFFLSFFLSSFFSFFLSFFLSSFFSFFLSFFLSSTASRVFVMEANMFCVHEQSLSRVKGRGRRAYVLQKQSSRATTP